MANEFARQKPTDRFKDNRKQLNTLIDSSKIEQIDYLKTFGIEINRNFEQVNGRYLKPPKLCGSNGLDTTVNDGEWKATFAKSAKLPDNFKWIAINYTRKDYKPIFAPGRRDVDNLINGIISSAKANGLNLGFPSNIIYDAHYSGRPDLYNAVEDYIKKYPGLRFVLLIIPINDEIYNTWKFKTELHCGIITQCVSQKESKQFSNPSYVGNIMLKINTKLCGVNFHLKERVGHLRKKTMIMGLDTTHGSKTDRMVNSIATTVASYDRDFVNYHTLTMIQARANHEIIQLKDVTVEHLNNFHKKNNFYPDLILAYRDGISQGQFQDVFDQEINQMKEAFSMISPAYNPKLTYIVVQKRHHTRFLPVEEKERNQKTQNSKPGLVVDNGITSHLYNEFYLTSHKGSLGTSRPARYVILYHETDANNDSGKAISNDDIQQATYYLTHLFQRCNKSVSIVAPVLYAHLAAARARKYISVIDNGRIFKNKLEEYEALQYSKQIRVKDELKNTLYYI